MAISAEVRTPAGPGARPWRGGAALAGLLGAAVAVGVAELLGGLLQGVAQPVLVVGDRVVDLAPPALKDFAVAAFGTADKAVLLAGIAVVCGLVGAALGVLAARRRWLGTAGFGGFAALGAAAAAADPGSGAVATAAALAVAVAAGVFTLHRLLRAAAPISAGSGTTARATHSAGHEGRAADINGTEDLAEGAGAGDGAAAPAAPSRRAPRRSTGAGAYGRAPDDPPAFDRRRFFRLAAGAGAVAAVTAAGGRVAARPAQTEVARSAVSLPAPLRSLPPAPAGASLDVEGLSPLFVPNDSFYRIDTALSIPQVDPHDWRLDFTGMVERPFSLTFDELLDEEMEEGDITLACVSNEVGGQLVGNARWLGVPLAGLLERAGVRPGATQIVGRSVEGFTVGFPTEVALDGRQALVAVGMNGEPLPAKHGFPARLVVPGLFGYVSATKWLAEVELTTWESFDAYWVPRGWDKRAPVLTQSRIDVPATGRALGAGVVQVAGVAWQPNHGIAGVEVSIDDGQWRPAELADDLADSAWRQWRYPWHAEPGNHTIAVRATDGSGSVQTSVLMGPRPFGATGYHTVRVRVDPS